MRSEGYGTWSVCLSVCLCVCAYSHTTGNEAAHERYQQLQCNKRSKIKMAILLKRQHSKARNWHCRGPCFVAQPINYLCTHAYMRACTPPPSPPPPPPQNLPACAAPIDLSAKPIASSLCTDECVLQHCCY